MPETLDPIWSMRLHRDPEDNGKYYTITTTPGTYIAVGYRDGTWGIYGPDHKWVERVAHSEYIKGAIRDHLKGNHND